ncbi:hypothetical protein C0993_000042 [Termitomyces sp. T159_Od127]|nr:hypothetical protein C0993_000042 [Termitomyces sp. T159_Od127]
MAPEMLQGIEQRIKQRETALKHPLQTTPVATHAPHGNIPNTPLAASTIAFLLAEEKALIGFFGTDYVRYQQRVGTKIPFVP